MQHLKSTVSEKFRTFFMLFDFGFGEVRKVYYLYISKQFKTKKL